MNSNELTEDVIKATEIEKVFLYYDEPILYTLLLTDGNRFFVLFVDEDKTNQIWFYTRISEERYQQLVTDEIDLYSSFKNAEDEYIYKVIISKNDDYSISKISIDKIDESSLPEKWVYLSPDEPEVMPSKWK